MPRLAPHKIEPVQPRPGDAIKCHWWHGAPGHCDAKCSPPTTLIRLYEFLKNNSRLQRQTQTSISDAWVCSDQVTSQIRGWWWRMTGSNRRPPACKAGALPAELIPPHKPVAFQHGSSTPRIQADSSRVVGLVGFEPTTPALSRRCSNRLSYRPHAATHQAQPRICHC